MKEFGQDRKKKVLFFHRGEGEPLKKNVKFFSIFVLDFDVNRQTQNAPHLGFTGRVCVSGGGGSGTTEGRVVRGP